MNSIKNRAEEIVLNELIYVQEDSKVEEIRLYEMYLNEAIEERKYDLVNKSEEYKNLKKSLMIL